MIQGKKRLPKGKESSKGTCCKLRAKGMPSVLGPVSPIGENTNLDGPGSRHTGKGKRVGYKATWVPPSS